MASPPVCAPLAESRRARVRRLVRMHLLLAAALLLYTFVIGRCPIRWLTGVPCPGLRDDPRPHPCGASGLRRRVLLSSALVRRPARRAVPRPPGRLASAGGKRARQILVILLGAAFLAVYLYRLFWQPDPAIRVDFGASAVGRLFARLTA